ncbi:MAG: aminoglycoside phosphotransferase family protein [Acidimicrobiia bacterium]|nr:MAG: aminoglycoside phosphotransferase family protein [Acidimicrobiia bacterium]
MQVPVSLDWMTRDPAAREWREAVPAVAAACAERWSLTLGEPFPGSFVSLVLPASLPGGDEAVLKIQWPHPESEHEAAALAAWDGDGAVRLLDHDAERHALLLERCRTGVALSTIDPQAGLEVMAGLIARLSIPAGVPFRSLADEALDWANGLRGMWEAAGRPFEVMLIDGAVGVLLELARAPVAEPVLLHQDLHGDNVLSAERRPWLAIDPKPLVGDPAFAVAPVVRSYEFGHSRREVWHRLDFLVDRFGFDPERARGWAMGQTLAWAFEGRRLLPRHLETARWLHEGR